MRLKKLHLSLMALAVTALANTASAQLYIDNAQFTIQSGATVTVQGDVTSNTDILGPGKLLLKGSLKQKVNMGGFSIPNLEIDNTTDTVALTGDAKIGTSVLFTKGKITVGNHTVTLLSGATASGMGTSKFFETDSAGFVRREVTADITNAVMPVGTGTTYTPVSITNTGSSYSAASIGVQAKGIADPNKHPRTESYLNVYWPISKTGISNGTTSAVGTYADPLFAGVNENDLKGMYWNGTTWSVAGGSQNATSNTAGATVSANTGDLYAMNGFVLLRAKAFLQGAYSAGVMTDKLRNSTSSYTPGALPATNLLPSTDPYRDATYPFNALAIFTKYNDNIGEDISTVASNPFKDQAITNDNIVDWVFLELRSAVTPGNTVIQTRSALIQKDGDIVDIDGVSPVYFKNTIAGTAVPPGAYTIAIKHRNHLAMSTNPGVGGFTQALDLTANAVKLDFSTLPASSLMGTANAAYLNSGGVNIMYAGNTNINTQTKWAAPNSDKDNILSTAAPFGLAGSAITTRSNVYSHCDVDLNRTVKWAAPTSDKDFILSQPLAGSATSSKTQVLPN